MLPDFGSIKMWGKGAWVAHWVRDQPSAPDPAPFSNPPPACSLALR